ncbi:MAG: hypothetical protein JXQ27_10380 [Acidobacteria bacterium]|nr:hypothetical protein [Acidobacteriota bacterium]
MAAGGNPVSLIVCGIMGFSLLLFYDLSVVIRDRALTVFFGVGLIRKRFHLNEILSARAVRNPWYYGWGIRLTPYGWMFNVSGLGAVELELRSGRRFRIGTDEPDRLVAAIRQATASI